MVDVQEVKSVITPTTVVQRYLGQPFKRINDKLWYKSPFRDERTASFVVSDERGIHDFGTSEHYDIISFIQKLYNLSFNGAINFLIQDFGLKINDVHFDMERIEQLKEEQKQQRLYREKITKWYNNTFIFLCNIRNIVDNRLLREPLNEKLYDLDMKINLYIELFLDVKKFEDKKNIYENEREEVEKLDRETKE